MWRISCFIINNLSIPLELSQDLISYNDSIIVGIILIFKIIKLVNTLLKINLKNEYISIFILPV
jgi:hypothetical protein